MRFLTLVILLHCSMVFSASKSYNTGLLETGDVLLQPIRCWSCGLIEDQENSEYAHSAIFVRLNNQDYVAEALGEVRLIPFHTFMQRTKNDVPVRALRLKDRVADFEIKLLEEMAKLLKLPFDHDFLWDNYIDGKEALYCSEFIYKAFVPFTSFQNFAPKTMLFDVNPDLWDNYYRGKTPRGKLGISPEDFNKSSDFQWITDIKKSN